MDTTEQHINAIVLTDDQVDAIVAAHRALTELENAAQRAAWEAPGSYVSMETAEQDDFGRVAGIASCANSLLFDVLNNALHHAKQTAARDGIDRWNQTDNS